MLLTFISCNKYIESKEPLTKDPSKQIESLLEIENNSAIGGNHMCQIHCEDYHMFTYSPMLGSYLTQEQLDEWTNTISMEPLNDESYCTPEYNIKACIDYFNIPKEDFEQLCENEWSSCHNIDLLYSDDLEAIDEYYSDINARNATMIKQTKLDNLKLYLIEMCSGKTLSEIWSTPEEELTDLEKEIFDTRKVSLMRVIQLLGADRSKFEQAMEKANEKFPPQIWSDYDYQLDLVYNEDGSLKDFTIDDNLSVVEQDALFAGVDNFFTD